MFWQESGQVFEELFCVYRGESLMTDKKTRRRGGGDGRVLEKKIESLGK